MAGRVVAKRHEAERGLAQRAFLKLGHLANPLLRPMVGSGLVPIWGVVRHTGRTSGRSYATPIAVLASTDAFLIPLPFGPTTDWCRNLRAAGHGVLRWSGRDYAIDRFEIVDAATVLPRLGRVLRVLVPAFRIKQFLRITRSGTIARGVGTGSDPSAR